MRNLLLAVSCALLTVAAGAYAAGDTPARKHADYSQPPRGSWGVSWCGVHGIIWVQDAGNNWWRFSSEDGTAPDPQDAKGTDFFNEWLQSGPSDIVAISNVVCK